MKEKNGYKTSYSIHEENLKVLDYASKNTGLTKEELIKITLRLFFKKFKCQLIIKGAMVSYQARVGGYKPLNVYWSAEEYYFIQTGSAAFSLFGKPNHCLDTGGVSLENC